MRRLSTWSDRSTRPVSADDTPNADPVDEDLNRDGLLRVEVAGGGDGGGTATVDVASSKAGPATYDVTADDGTVSEQVIEQVHAGDDETALKFTYTAVETIEEGELKFTVPSGWSNPQADSSRTPGYTTAGPIGSIGSVTFSGASLNVPIYSLTTGETITIDYGEGDGGAVVPTSSGSYAFDIKIKGSETGSLKSISKAATVMVRPQASGRGTATIDTDGDVHAGDTGREVTITYTSVGQIVGGKLKVTVLMAMTGRMRRLQASMSPLVPRSTAVVRLLTSWKTMMISAA